VTRTIILDCESRDVEPSKTRAPDWLTLSMRAIQGQAYGLSLLVLQGDNLVDFIKVGARYKITIEEMAP
jgi:hypothetical protein